MRHRSLSILILTFLCIVSGSQLLSAACMPTFSSLTGGYVPFTSITEIRGPNEAGDFLVVGNMTPTAYQNLNTVPLPNAVNEQFCTTEPLAPSAMYFAYVPTVEERLGTFSSFDTSFSPPVGAPGPFGWRIPAGKKLFVSTYQGGQILTVDGNSGATNVLFTGGEQPFDPEGLAIGPDGKLYIAGPTDGAIWRMDQNGLNFETVFAGCGECSTANPEGPSFSGAPGGDLYFNTAGFHTGAYKIGGVATTPVGGPFNAPTQVIPAVCGDSAFCTGGTEGEGTGFDPAGNFLVVNTVLANDAAHGSVVSLPPPFTSVSTLVSGLIAPTAVAVNQGTGQLFISETGTQRILSVGPGGVTSTYFNFGNQCDCSDTPAYMQFDEGDHLYVITEINGSGQGAKVWRLDPPVAPATTPTATLLVSLSTLADQEVINSDQAIGIALVPTQSVTLTFSPGNNTQIATVGNPTDPAAQSLALTVASVLQPFQVTVEFHYEPTDLSTQSHGIGIADGICEAGATEQTDFDCRLAQDFTYQTLGNLDRVVPHIIPSHDNLGVWVRVTTSALPGVQYVGPVEWYYAWNANPSLTSVPGSEYPPGWNNKNPQFFDRPGENPLIDFVANITTYTKFNCNPTCVGTADPGIGGKTPTFNDVVAADVPNPPAGQADVVERLVPVPGISPFPYVAGLPMLVAFELEKVGTEISDPNALTLPHHVSAAVLDPATGLPVVVPTFPGFPTTFTYNPFFKLYYIFLSPAPLKPGKTYQLQINSDLFPKPVNANIVVRRSFF